MARVVKNMEKSDKLTMQSDGQCGRIILRRDEHGAFLYAIPDGGGLSLAFSGPATLRRLARAILKEVGKR
jgi:hypothetical protein